MTSQTWIIILGIEMQFYLTCHILVTWKTEHITPVLLQLHWLPVKCRSWYKLLLHTFKIMSGQAMVYLSNLIQKHRPIRLLLLEFASLLSVRCTNTVTHGRRSFSYSIHGIDYLKRSNVQQANKLFVRFIKPSYLN